MVSIKCCWEPAPRTLHHQRENGPTTHIIYLNELAVRIPTREAWDQMVWPAMVVIPCVPTKAKSYGYCRGQAVDLGPMMPAAQFHVTEERGTYPCTTRALVFEGSILTYNPALNEAEWVPVCRLANDLSWADERSAVALANYVLCTQEEAGQVVSCLGDDSSTEWEDLWFSNTPSTGPHTDMAHEVAEESEEPVQSKEEANGWTSPREGAGANPHTDHCRHSQNCPLWKNWRGWLTMTPTLALMLPSQGWTARWCLHYLHVRSLEIPHPPLPGVQPLMHWGCPWSRCHCWCLQLPHQLLVQTQ